MCGSAAIMYSPRYSSLMLFRSIYTTLVSDAGIMETFCANFGCGGGANELSDEREIASIKSIYLNLNMYLNKRIKSALV